jgi:hypothetical protein
MYPCLELLERVEAVAERVERDTDTVAKAAVSGELGFPVDEEEAAVVVVVEVVTVEVGAEGETEGKETMGALLE